VSGLLPVTHEELPTGRIDSGTRLSGRQILLGSEFVTFLSHRKGSTQVIEEDKRLEVRGRCSAVMVGFTVKNNFDF
jgi:hypothetical protein